MAVVRSGTLAAAPDPKGRAFGLHLCSVLYPWARKASSAQKRDARAKSDPPGTPQGFADGSRNSESATTAASVGKERPVGGVEGSF